MEMEFKDSSRRRTLVLTVGVLLALVAGAGVFYLSSQDYRKFALQQVEEARRFVAELGLGPKQQ